MSVSVSSSPQYPIPGRPARLTFAASTGARIRLFVTNAPKDSKLREEIDKSGASQVKVHEGDVGTPFDFTADMAGAYTIKAQELEVPEHGPSFRGDDRAFIDIGDGTLGTEKVLSETTATLHFGLRLTMPMGIGSDTATLVLFVWGDTIRATTSPVHGETSPRIERPSTTVARTASVDATVATKLAALVNATADSVIGTDLSTSLDLLIDRMMLHFLNDVVHIAADTTNVIENAFKASGSKAGFPKSVAKAIERMGYHMATDATVGGISFGPGTGDWHSDGSGFASDNIGIIRATAPNDMTSATIAYADLCRAYDEHINNTNVHSAVDNSSPLPTLPPLIDLHKAFLTVTASNNPTAPAEENAGGTILVHGAGMKAS